ncbi:Acetyl esterase/lipase [Flexibacter flexilis DSM 6793]|uniref:Acetyl esterase/lipase n=1 Tax=Flexibacter flexilis DSM 6793 TaxID=927664 RepID=A0A1I1MSR5_9BACT|nr:alpha/beta hydrolase [Flexibacter flexilis]SFC84600.1 Acetyl esterase/lipase [Flexibacter flexilis DSM 6793]
MQRIFLVVGLWLLAALTGWAQNSYQTQTNVHYYPANTYGTDVYKTERCVLDIYYPKNKKGFATIVWFHGGGLTGGSKEIPEYLKEKGCAVVGVGYRLHPNVQAPVYIEDAAAAVAWVFGNMPQLGADTSLIFLSGHSAGGYLDLMLGLDKQWLARHRIDANRIAGLIPFSPQCITHFTVRKERGMDDKQPLIDTFAPLYHVRADAPPLLLITGDREKELLGRYEENAYMARMMQLKGHTATTLYELQGYDHQMAEPAYPLLLKEIKRITEQKKKK